jgi:DNA processing protein
MTEREALLILNAVPNLDAVRIRKLIKNYGSAAQALEACENIIHFPKDKFLQDEYNLMQRSGVTAMTAADGHWPCSFKNFEDAPLVLYVKGDTACLAEMSLAVVGSRAASFYGRAAAKKFAQAFVRAGITVVSGLARGIDTAAHQGALEAGGRTVAVIGCGFSHMYPKENLALMEAISRQGAVVSEFAFSMPPLKYNFPWRNRIISALARATVVIEAGRKSGALITADYALAQNKDVFVLPSNIDNETALGSNQLIQDGARVALSPDDIMSQIRENYVPGVPQAASLLLLSDEQAKIYPYITYQPVHLEELARQSGMHITSLMNITLSLELKRAIRQLPGQYYVRNENA